MSIIIHTSNKKKKTKRAPGWEKELRELEARNKRLGINPNEKKNKRVFKELELKAPNLPSQPSSLNSNIGSAYKKNDKKYTGDKLIGIAVMHKSNLVPVFKQEDAADISRMRRG